MDIDLHKTQQYIDWLKEKLYLNHIAKNAKNRQIRRGEVYQCKFGVGIGSEECKERPCLILQYDSANKTSPNTLVAPITHTLSTVPVIVPIVPKTDSSGKIILDGNILLGNITCVSKARLGNFVVKLSNDEMTAVDKAIAISLNIFRYYETLQNKINDREQFITKLQEQIVFLQNSLKNVSKKNS